MSEVPSQSKLRPKIENCHVLGNLRWPIVLVLALVIGFAVGQYDLELFGFVLLAKDQLDIHKFKSVQEHLPTGLIFLFAFLVSYLATLEVFIRIIFAFLPGVAVGVVIWLPFRWSDYLWVFIICFGFFSWMLLHWRICNSTWIGARCRKCNRRGTIKMKSVKKDLIGSFKTEDIDGIRETRQIYRRTVRFSCNFCGLAWTKLKEGSGDTIH